jgi:2-amino-4-hydroxy-6-hydroxymethyldihydropteridine diphosphokinase
MNHAFLLLGSNLGNAELHLKEARKAIELLGPIIEASSLYSSQAWGKTDQPDFLNQVIEISTGCSPQRLLREILAIESELGRVRQEKWGARIIDIDILFYNSEIINEPDLKIPHPEIANRKFTLIPLSEIAAEWIHPVLNKSVQQLLLACSDKLDVRKLN